MIFYQRWFLMYQKNKWTLWCFTISTRMEIEKVEKLVANLHDKTEYVI